MRGYRVRINEGDGEVEENFWAQAAADQAAGRRAEEADESALISPGKISCHLMRSAISIS